MALSSLEIFKSIKQNFRSPIEKTDDVIAKAINLICEEKPSELEIAEFVQKYKKKITNFIQKDIEDCVEKKIESDIIFGTTEEFLKRTKVNLVDAQNDFNSWISQLDPLLFEKFSKKILELEGCENVKVTPSSGDGGIDLYGTKEIVINDKSAENVFRNITLLVIGQSKRYKDEIGISQLREFVGSVSMIKYSLIENSPKSFAKPIGIECYKPLTPLLMTFITSNKANKNTAEVAKWLGVRFIDGFELSRILYRNNLGFHKYKDSIKFEPEEIEDEL